MPVIPATRRTIGALAVCAAALAVAPAAAQAPSTAPVPRPAETVNLTMEQRHIIKEIVIKDMKAVPQAAKVTAKVGDKVPSGVLLQPVPVEVGAKIPQVKAHSFFVKDNKVVIVDPKNDKIAAVVE